MLTSCGPVACGVRCRDGAGAGQEFPGRKVEAALAEHLEVKLKCAGVPILGKEGLAQADWVLLDTAEVIVHLFRPEVRDFYSLERMWDTATPRDEIVHVHAD